MKQTKKQFKAFVIAASFFCMAFAVAGCSDSSSKTAVQNSTASESAPQSSIVLKIEEGGSLEIPVSEISEKASFYSVELEDTEMEIIAVRDQIGTIRTAFNTCQICYDSGRGYYKQSGDYLVCQNCGNRFTMDQVETESGGCNPWPIFAEDKTVTDGSILISYEFLDESRKIFENWKSNY